MKTIVKYGSFDNYILKMDPKKLHSKYGDYLREEMEKKIKDPEYQVG